MSRPTVLTGFHAHGQAHAGHYRVPAQQSHYEAMAHSGLPFARPLPMGAPVLAAAGYTHQQHHHHQHLQHSGLHHASQNHNHHPHSLAMADPYLASDEELAHLQKLSSEYEPEATVGLPAPQA